MAAIVPLRVSTKIDHALARLTTDPAVAATNVYDVEGINPQGVAKWVDRAGGIAIGYPQFTMSIRPPTKASRVYKVTVKLVLPTLEQTSPSTSTGIQPAPTKAYDCMVVSEFMLPERSTLAERQNLLSLYCSLFVRTINASDNSPTDTTSSPLEKAVTTFENVF